MANYVDQTKPTDQDADSTGCGMAFLSWMMSQGYGLDKITPAMVSLGDAGTLAQLYANLTSDAAANAWPNFQAAIQNLPNGVTSDDPFAGAPKQLAAMKQLQPTAPSARAAGIAAPAAKGVKAAVCSPRSRRLLPPKRKSA
jgi:hypothetical protein